MSKRQKAFQSRKGQSGQMAVFIALIFQVLFVFFAMAINIGLVVHDKINLQNAVDLSAYYVAQRQAEWLNVIAHQNYQIRQSYKLMAWRYRVLGNMGLTDGAQRHPVYGGGVGVTDDMLYGPSDDGIACITYQPVWTDIGAQPNGQSSRDTFCKEQETRIRRIDEMPQIPFSQLNPLNQIFRQLAVNIQRQIASKCEEYGGYNFSFVNAIKFMFRHDQARLKKSITAIAQNMAKPAEQMVALDGGVVAIGARKTLEKNLTFENLRSLQAGDGDFKIYNSVEEMPPEDWLNEIKIKIKMYYKDAEKGASNDCRSVVRMASEPPSDQAGRDYAFGGLSVDPAEAARLMAGDPPQTSIERLSLGYEKNPWIRIYAGVKARTKPRQLFFPFGDPVDFEAVGYASPFGGRIGPWYKDKWAPGESSSTGALIDPLAPPLAGENLSDISASERMLPNYSRYMGDRLGLSSALAQVALNNQLGIRAKLRDVTANIDMVTEDDVGLDVLSWDRATGGQTSLRQYEIAAVAPDIFDVMYYSIEPNFGRTYLPKLRTLIEGGRLDFPNDAYPRLDLGGRDGVDGLNEFSVKDQMAAAGSEFDSSGVGRAARKLHRNEPFWFVRDKAHLLTSWVHNDTIANFEEFPEKRYAKCETWDDNFKQKIPGSCLFNGGRTGYSVKIISGDFLRSAGIRYGGAGQSGPIENPPPDDW